jgi:uncharacterized damage-inducible protein DinB
MKLEETTMFTSVAGFLDEWRDESPMTRSVFSALTEQCLTTAIGPCDRNLGRLAWHITTCIPHIMASVGLPAADLREDSPMPSSLTAIRDTYADVSAALAREVEAQWTDDSLELEDVVFGYTWRRGLTLTILVHHEIHHRGQMTVLMRQAGLRPPAMYGPVREDWAAMGVPEPAI